MSGHNKFSKIKHIKAKTDAQKSKMFTKISNLISIEAKKANGNLESPSLKSAIEKGRAVNMPNDTIERAIKKATDNSLVLEPVLYEAYSKGGIAIIISALTDNRNRTSSEIKHILREYGSELSAQGSASWAFTKDHEGWKPNTTMPVSEEDAIELEKLIEALEENDDVHDVYTNAE